MSFRQYKLTGTRLNPEVFDGREPSYRDVLNKLKEKVLRVDIKDMVSVNVSRETLWISRNSYEKASKLLGQGSYEAHEGATLTAAKGAWIILGEPKPVEPPIGAPKNKRYVRVQTKLGQNLGLDPFIVEECFVFKGFKGEDVEIGKITNFRYFLLAYNRNRNCAPLTQSELSKTLLWKNYLSRPEVKDALVGVSKFLREGEGFWHVERMDSRAFVKYKVVWRDVADKFIPAVCIGDLIPDYTVNYVVVDSEEEAYYLMSVLLAPQINAVVEELTPWIGHVQPRFLKYFKIPKYNERNDTHKSLANIGREIASNGLTNEHLEEIEKLVEKL